MPAATHPQNFRALKLNAAFFCATAASLAAAAFPAPIVAAETAQDLTESFVRIRARNCANLAGDGLTRMPSVRPLFQTIATQPITGMPITARIADPVYRVQICRDESVDGSGDIAAYQNSNKRIFVGADKIDFESIAHESYHAYQAILGGFVDKNTPLSARDRSMALLLVEASAVAYTLMLTREVGFSDPKTYQELLSNPNAVYGMAPHFDKAFTRAYTVHANLEETARRTAALQEAGSYIINLLLMGVEDGWSRPYASRAVEMAKTSDPNIKTDTSAYRAMRDEVFRRTGVIGSTINIVPAQFLGADADTQIEKTLDDIGVAVVRVRPPDFTPRLR